MELKSEYFVGLSKESQGRYENKLLSAGLQMDPYSITRWIETPEVIPAVQWSDMMLYMISTPSPHTKEEIKVLVYL